MSKSYSLTEMRNHFAEIVHETEQATMVQVTRRGKPFAFLVSVQEYEQLKKSQTDLKSSSSDSA